MKNLYLLLALIMLSVLCRAQFPIAECLNEDTDNEYVQNRDGIYHDSRNGYELSPHGTLHVLLIFAEIEYDIHPENDPNPNGIYFCNLKTIYGRQNTIKLVIKH